MDKIKGGGESLVGEKEEGRPTEEKANPNTNADQNQPTGSHRSTGFGESKEGGETRWEELPLDPQHVDKLKSSGISPLTAKSGADTKRSTILAALTG